MTSKNDFLTNIFYVFLSEVWLQCHPDDPLFPLGFTSIKDHLRAEEVWLGCGLPSGKAPVRISINFWSRAV
jgi:hypothetical protein